MSYIIIPDSVKKLKNLNPNAKLIYGDILSLSAQSGYCYANNEYLANIYGFTTRVISKIISQLLTAGIIELREGNGQYGKGRKIVPLITIDNEQSFHEHRTIVPRTNVPETTNERSNNIEQSFQQTGTNVLKDRNERSTIIDNRIDNIIDNRIDKENISDFSLSETKKEKEQEPAESAKYYFEVTQVLELLTNLTGVKFSIPKTKLGIEKYEPYKLIKERLKDGATLEDILAVVEMKNKEWAGTQIYVYMKPSTLFRKSKFDSYLQQLQISAKVTKQQTNHIIPLPEFNVFTGKGIDLTKDPSYCPELGF